MADTQRERLIEILKQGSCPSSYICDENCKYADLESCYEPRVADLLLANGVIVPPCKVGDMVYVVNGFGDIDEFKVEYFVFDKSEIDVGMEDDGEYNINEVYFHKEDAERALREREET